MRRHARRQAKQRKNLAGVVIGAVAGLILVGLFVRGQRPQRAFDSDNCP